MILLVVLLAKSARTQTCSGSVGDPIVNITFGAGTQAIGQPLPSGTTSLSYYAFDCPDNGQYTISGKTSGCFGNSWHSLTDHTGDANGYFMLVNASIDTSTFYLQTIDGLCAGTTFQFSAWIANMCNFPSILPRIVLTVEKTDGTVLGTYNTGDIPVNTSNAEWKQYGFNFTMPVGVSTVVLRMQNNAPGGVGNDLALDDITFRPIGPKISASTSDFSGDTTLLCIKDAKKITFHSNVEKCYATTAYRWQVSTDNGTTWTDIAGAAGPDYAFTPTATGTYQYRVTVSQSENINSAICRVNSNIFKIAVYGENVRTVSIAKPPGAICEDEPVTFKASTTYAGSDPSFQWMINNQPVVNANDSVYTTKSLSSGDKVNCYFVSSLSCNDPLTSNVVPAEVLIKAHTTIDSDVCEGENYEGYTTSGTYEDVFPGSNGCDSTRTLNLVVHPKEHSVFDTSICYGTSYLGLTKDGSYNYTYQSVFGCDSVHTVELHVLPDINTKPHTDTILCTGDQIVYSPGVFDNYQWQDGSADSSYTIFRGGSYRVTVSNKCGTAVKTIYVKDQVCIVDFPTAFTPNSDGRNDVFRVVNAYDVSLYHCVIFNRWGQKVFETSDPQKGWDGSLNARVADNGVYLWFCEYVNRSKPAEHISLKGTVVLMR